MPTASVHIPEVGGYVGRARCFAIDPPYEGNSYVTVWVQRGFGQAVRPEVVTVPATETGACSERSLMRRPGSYVLHDDVQTDEEFDGACWLALQMLGRPGYDLIDAS